MGKSQGTAYVLKMKKQANLASKISSLEHTNMQSEERLCSKTFFSFFPSYFFPFFFFVFFSLYLFFSPSLFLLLFLSFLSALRIHLWLQLCFL